MQSQSAHTLRLLPLALYPSHDDETVSLSVLRKACRTWEIDFFPAWVRTQTWKVLLGYLSPAKRTWQETVEKRRAEYLRFMTDFSSEAHTAAPTGNILNQIYKDLVRCSDVDADFYDAPVLWPLETLGTPDAGTRHAVLERLESVNAEYANCAERDRPRIRADSNAPLRYVDRQWHSMFRILYLYAVLNPSVGYIQGMNEVLHVFLRAAFRTRDLQILDTPAQDAELLGIGKTCYAEADAFWCFSLLMGELRELYDFGHSDASTFAAMRQLTDASPASPQLRNNGMAHALFSFSERLHMLDSRLADFLDEHGLDPRLPYYSLRWLACVYATEFSLDGVMLLWDVLFAETVQGQTDRHGKIAMLLDVGCAMLLHIRGQLYQAAVPSTDRLSMPSFPGSYDSPRDEHPPLDTFQRIMQLLQSYPENNVRTILGVAQGIQQHAAAQHTQATLPRDAVARRAPQKPACRASRGTPLQERLAATVQKSLHTPPLRAASFPPPPPDPSSPMSPIGSGASFLRKYTEAFQSSDAAASMSKASTNLAAKALAWRSRPSRSVSDQYAFTTPKEAHEHAVDSPQLPAPSVVDGPEDRDAYKTPLHKATAECDSLSQAPSVGPIHLTLPSMRAAAELGIVTAPGSDAASATPPLAKPSGLSRCIPSGTRDPPKPLPSVPLPGVERGTKSHRGTLDSTNSSGNGPAAEHLNALLAEFKSTEWIKDK
ncbi:hypothetical protein MVES1_000662 [Malassezia vespertilionis]|uniref:Rab-GAP TBC domain-containing protein n=1 Tax=Malassezia vespertilionis TaxID=2020962 RepID=A0A2N1JH58_9BASI|nr:uncharacterized protein MVES1_000662 [Malassezia vespertilionis]PKI85891.1 hypothetical protein MVES_000615 [Malassezia vespertilionis]WFD05332.1 hypothetical protein MVES1_000662 [Malassezia vespertilionis]